MNFESDIKDIGIPSAGDYFPEIKTNKEKKKEWNKKVFNNTPAKVVTRNSDAFWKIFAVLSFILLSTSLGLHYWALNDGRYDGLISSNFNTTINNDVFNEFSNTFNNDDFNTYENEFNNDFTIELDISEELIERYCNSS